MIKFKNMMMLGVLIILYVLNDINYKYFLLELLFFIVFNIFFIKLEVIIVDWNMIVFGEEYFDYNNNWVVFFMFNGD